MWMKQLDFKDLIFNSITIHRMRYLKQLTFWAILCSARSDLTQMTISFVLTSACCPPILDKFLLENPPPWGAFADNMLSSTENLFWCCSINNCFCIDVSGNVSRFSLSVGGGKPLWNGNVPAGIDGEDWRKFLMNWDASMDSSPGGIGNAGFAPITGGPVSKIERRMITNDMQPSFFTQHRRQLFSKIFTCGCPKQFIRRHVVLARYKAVHCCIIF